VRFDDGTLMSLTAAQLRGEEPIVEADPASLAEEQRKALQSVLGEPRPDETAPAASSARPPSQGSADAGQESQESQESKPRRRSRRRKPRSSQAQESAPADQDGAASRQQPSRRSKRRPRRPQSES
jgi:hypothetical protein